MDMSRPVRQTRPFDLEDFRDIGSSKVLGKAVKNFNKLAMHKGDRKIKIPLRGLKIVKSSSVKVTPAKAPYA